MRPTTSSSSPTTTPRSRRSSSGSTTDGITKSNTLFVVTVDEGDHFAGGQGTPQPDGSLAYAHTNCVVLTACPSNQIGEVNVKVQSVVPAGSPLFSIHADDAPTFYVNGNPTRNDPAVRKLERDLAGLMLVDPYAGAVPCRSRNASPIRSR